MKKHTRRNKQNTRSILDKTWWRITDVYTSKLPSLLEVICAVHTDKKKKKQLSSYIKEFIWDQVQSHIWLPASSYMVKYLRISPYIRKLFQLIYDFAPIPSEFPYI
jgi:hypothetical protein